MLTKRYFASQKNIAKIMKQIIAGTAPSKFNLEHLKTLGFKSSTDRAIIPLLKDLGFLSDDGTPTRRYHDYRDTSKSRVVLGKALLETYEDVFHVKEKPTESDRKEIVGKFKSTHNVSDWVAECQTSTFFSLLKLADIEAPQVATAKTPPAEKKKEISIDKIKEKIPISLRYNIEIHLPATKDIEVYNAIFKALREHLGD